MIKIPFTPFHLGVSILFIAIFPFLDPIALFVGSIIPDIEGISAIFLFPESNLPLHGPFHSFTGSIILGTIIAIGSWGLNKILANKSFNSPLAFIFRPYSFSQSLLSSFLGTFSHILLDAIIYPEMDLLYPLGFGNPLYGIFPFSFPYLFCVGAFFLGLIIICIKLLKRTPN